MPSMYTVTPRSLKKHLVTCMNANLVPIVLSSPGLGKSDIVKQIADQYNLEVIDIRLAQADITDLNGLPRFTKDRAEFVPFDIFPLEDTPLPKNKSGWLIFFDELTSAPRNIQAASYKILLDRQVGNHKLHPDCVLMAAGNRKEDKAVVNIMSSALVSRMIYFTLEPSVQEWMEDFAIPHNLDPRIIAFINAYPEKLNTFDPEKAEESYSCPRTIEFIDRLIKSKSQLTGSNKLEPEDKILFAGAIGDGVATEFYQFCEVYTKVPKYKDIIADPDKVDVPDDSAMKWASITSLVQNCDKKDSAQFIKYISRFDVSFQIVFLRMLLQRDSTYLVEPHTKKLVLTLNSYLGSLS